MSNSILATPHLLLTPQPNYLSSVVVAEGIVMYDYGISMMTGKCLAGMPCVFAYMT